MDKGAQHYERFLHGDKNAIGDIIEEYRAGLELYIYSVVGDICLAEEITQETFVKLFTKKPRFRASASFKTWLYTIGKNSALNYIKKHSRNVSLDCENGASVHEDVETLEEIYIADERKKAVHKALGKLKKEYREVLWLTYFEGMSNKESADVMNKKVHNIHTLLTRARQALKKQLEEDGFDYEI